MIDKNKVKVVDVTNRNSGIYADKYIELYISLCIPSCVNSYSIAVEYIKKWFLFKFDDSFFKTVYIDNSHVFNEMRDFEITKNLKKSKPSLAIIPEITLEHDRDKLDWHPYGINQYIKRAEEHGEFFRDPRHNIYMSMLFEQLLVTTTFRMRVSTKAQQIDLFKHIQMACKVGATETNYIDMDVHIPYKLMVQLATDLGFEILNGKIVRVGEFTKYLNAHSYLPIILKYRTINGKYEFFIRFPNMCVHLSLLDSISVDNGEREGMLTNNYIIELPIEIKIPNPKFYVYYSTYKHDIIKSNICNDKEHYHLGLYAIKLFDIPEVNEKGWNQYLTTQILEEDTSTPLEVCFSELIDEGTTLHKILQHNYSLHISPSIFIDIKLYNNSEEVEYDMDWETLTVKTKENLKSQLTYVSIYVDNAYLNEQVQSIKGIEISKRRFTESEQK